MPSKPASVLKIETLSAEIGGQGILHDVSLEMAPAEWLAVVGGSGAGKSTLLRAIMGLTRPARPTSGHILFNGSRRAFASPSKTLIDGIAFVPQSPAYGFDPMRRLRWQWDQLARHKPASLAQHQRDILAALGLPELDDRYPHQWSRGMQQRLSLAVAVIHRPRVLILDEPTSALDPLIGAQVLRETRRIAAEQGVAVMMVTHDLALASCFASRIAIMQQGQIVEAGPAGQLLSSPQHPYSRELVAHRCWDTTKPRIRHAAE